MFYFIFGIETLEWLIRYVIAFSLFYLMGLSYTALSWNESFFILFISHLSLWSSFETSFYFILYCIVWLNCVTLFFYKRILLHYLYLFYLIYSFIQSIRRIISIKFYLRLSVTFDFLILSFWVKLLLKI